MKIKKVINNYNKLKVILMMKNQLEKEKKWKFRNILMKMLNNLLLSQK